MFINKSWKYKYTVIPIWHEQRCEITYGRNIYFICKALFFFSRFWLAHLVKNGLIHMYLSRLLIRKLRTPISQNTFYQERNDYPNYS